MFLLTEPSHIIWTGANELTANGNSENNPRFTPSGNPLGTFLISKYYFVINKNDIELLIPGVKTIIHTRVILMLENTDCCTNEQKTGQ